jgi:protein-tyrosine-phosphatase
MKKNILFICKYNRFRSKIAESYFNNIKSDDFSVKSAGIFLDCSQPDINEISAAKNQGIEIHQNFQSVSTDIWDWADLVVVVANNIPVEIFRKNNGFDKEILVWDITDNHCSDLENMSNIIKSIISKVDNLFQELKLEEVNDN